MLKVYLAQSHVSGRQKEMQHKRKGFFLEDYFSNTDVNSSVLVPFVTHTEIHLLKVKSV